MNGLEKVKRLKRCGMISENMLKLDSRVFIMEDGEKYNITDEAQTMLNRQRDVMLHIFDICNKEITMAWCINMYVHEAFAYEYEEESNLSLIVNFFNGYTVHIKWAGNPDLKFYIWVMDRHSNQVFLKDEIVSEMLYFDMICSDKICDILRICSYVSDKNNVEEMIREHKKITEKMWDEAALVD